MNQSLWRRFSHDWRENCRLWRHDGVAIPPTHGVQAVWTANPDFFEGDLYYRDHGETPDRPGENHDRILRHQQGQAPELIVDVGEEYHALDPAVVRHGDRLLLYYSAVGHGPDRVGLAASDDEGRTWRKLPPVREGRAPEVWSRDGQVHMLFQLLDGENRYRLHHASSSDGLAFSEPSPEPVFAPVPGAWDGFSVVTFRLATEEEGWLLALYGGSAQRSDEPEAFGLARSRDGLVWERHPGNPVFGVGALGEPDGGAIWFPALQRMEGGWQMLYEGSEGNYAWNLRSQICAAFLPDA